jgi:transposase
MSLHPCRIKPVPLTTRQVAQAAFPKGNLYLTMRDEIGTLYSASGSSGGNPASDLDSSILCRE